MANSSGLSSEQMSKVYAICLEPIPLGDTLNPDEYAQVDFYLDQMRRLNDVISEIDSSERSKALKTVDALRTDLEAKQSEFEKITSTMAKVSSDCGAELEQVSNRIEAVQATLHDTIKFLERFRSACNETAEQITDFVVKLKKSIASVKMGESLDGSALEKSGCFSAESVLSSTHVGSPVAQTLAGSPRPQAEPSEAGDIATSDPNEANIDNDVTVIADEAFDAEETASDKENVPPTEMEVDKGSKSDSLLHRFVCSYCPKSFKSSANWHKHQVNKHLQKKRPKKVSHTLPVAIPSTSSGLRKKIVKRIAYRLCQHLNSIQRVPSAVSLPNRHI